MSVATVKHISEWFIKPKYEVQDAKQPYYLGPNDLAMLSTNYIQKDLLFHKPSHLVGGQVFEIHQYLESLKDSLSVTLVYFYPMAGQLTTQVDEDRHQSLIFVDCRKGPGARFIHAMLDMTISDVLSPTYVPVVVQSFFDHDRAVSYDGHYRPLLTVQVTELLDGVFIGCSMNHVLGDGNSYWKLWNLWSRIHRVNCEELVPASHLPIHKRWFPDGFGPAIYIPFTEPEKALSRYEPPELRERIFHFSSDSIAKLKAQANKENSSSNISSFQALSALCWRTIIRALGLPGDQVTNYKLATNNRHRIDPILPPEYFGNFISAIQATTTFAELLQHNLGWAASMINQSVINQSDKKVRDFMNYWFESPFIFTPENLIDGNSVMMGSSPRFDMYGNEFGLGKALAVRSGYANKFAGKVTSYPGYEGGGSVDLEICLLPESMRVLETDEEFMSAVSSPII